MVSSLVRCTGNLEVADEGRRHGEGRLAKSEVEDLLSGRLQRLHLLVEGEVGGAALPAQVLPEERPEVGLVVHPCQQATAPGQGRAGPVWHTLTDPGRATRYFSCKCGNGFYIETL